MTVKNIETVTVYLGASGFCSDIFEAEAENLGRLIAKNNLRLVFGGMSAGLMGILANSCMSCGGSVTGVIPSGIDDIKKHHGNLNNELIIVESLAERKKIMSCKADIVAVLPGGYGTIDEVSEILHWKSLGIYNTPIVFINIDGYWDSIISYIKSFENYRANYFDVVNNADEFIHFVRNHILEKDMDCSENISVSVGLEEYISQDTKTPLIIDHADTEEFYTLALALTLKQVKQCKRTLGLLNKSGVHDDFLRWIERAKHEKFITEHCDRLFSFGSSESELISKMEDQGEVIIDLVKDKWGI